MKYKLLAALMIPLVLSTTAFSKMVDVTETVKMESAQKISLSGELGAGVFKIEPKKTDDAAEFFISYNPKRVEYYVDSKIRRNRCLIDFGSEYLKKYNVDSEDNDWEIGLSTEYPLSLDLDIGACEANFELGGLKLEDLTMDVGAASGDIDFSEVNEIECDEIEIDAGASSVSMKNIGNANFSTFTFDGGVGSFDLDFRGEYKRSAEIEIDVGLGSAEITLPKNVAVRIETDDDSWFSSIDINADELDEVEDGIYESDDYEDADIRITLVLSVGMGSIDIYRK